ncbi:MAG TPA: DUF1553 domain-containing protein [Planctomycetota bacterium]
MIALILLLQDDARFFEERIRPVLVERCYECHGGAKVKGDLRLNTREGLRRVVADGALLRAVRWTDPELKMPPKEKLEAKVVEDIAAWIARGAPDPRVEKKPDEKPLWSLQPLRRAPADIDAFIEMKLREKGLRMSPPASRPALIRRLAFDLTGLPPTPEEVDAFVADGDVGKVVDRLLASPRYGERWGRHWLDAAHYGETHGYDKDKKRPHAWPYRDYVIRAFNEDRPYSRFVREQVAGDVLYPGEPEAIAALGFLAAGPWDFVGHVELPESKTDGLIARYNDRDDMLSTVMSTFQSLTVHCARCHDHKFDPIPQEDYYALQAVFAGVDRADRVMEADPKRLELEAELKALGGPSPSNGWHSGIESTSDRVKWVEVDLGREVPIDEIRLVPARPTDFRDTPGFGFPPSYRVELDGRLLAAAEDAENPKDRPVKIPGGRGRVVRVTATKLWERTKDFVFALAELEAMSGGRNVAAGAAVASLDSIEAGRWGRANLVDGHDSRAALGNAARRAELQKAVAALPPPRLVYAATSAFAGSGGFQPSKGPRPVHLLSRGDVKRPLRPAVPGALSRVPGPVFACADPSSEGQRRAALAAWLTDPANALLRRSIVNRVWHHHFGRGLVETPNDFGRMGAEPSHPELLDALAAWFQENGESVKQLHRLILLSNAWRQASDDNPAARAIDADNKLLWRMERRRLDAESFRDALLFVGGGLDLRMGGPSDEHFVFKDDHSPVYDYARFDPEASRRRSVYRFIVRSVPDPLFDALDAADPSILTPRRNTTLTALQALAALNDPFVLRQCARLAERAKDVDDMARLVWGRRPTPGESASLGAYAEKHGRSNLARVLFNSNEFVFVD